MKYVKLSRRGQELNFIDFISRKPKNNFLPLSKCEDTTPIKDIDISYRLKNVLSYSDIHTFKDLKNVEPTQLVMSGVCGKRSFEELNEILPMIS